MALKQSHVNQLRKIIASAEKLITEIEREMQSQQEGGGRGGRGAKTGGKLGRGSGRQAAGARKTASRRASSGSKASGGKEGASASRRGGGRKSASGEKSQGGGNSGTRRNRAQTAEFRQSILKELEGGAPVADLAAKHGITPAYIYQIKSRAEA